MTPEDATRVLSSLSDALQGGTLLPWAVEHCRDGDLLPEAWARCDMDKVTFRIAHRLGLLDHQERPVCMACEARPRHPCRACADLLLRIVPTLTLDEVVRRSRAGR